MDPGRFHRSRGIRLLWLCTPPVMLVAMSALALGYERLVHERLARLRAVSAVLPAIEDAQAKVAAFVDPLKARETAAGESERLHAQVSGMVRDLGLFLNSLAIDRHEDQAVAGATRFKLAVSVEGSLEEQAWLLARVNAAEPILVSESVRWTWLRTTDDGEDLYRGDMLFSLYRVNP